MEKFDKDFWCRGGLPPYTYIEARKSNARKTLGDFVRPNFARCPICNKRMVPRTINVEPHGVADFRYIIPPHKIPKTKRYKKVNGRKVKRKG